MNALKEKWVTACRAFRYARLDIQADGASCDRPISSFAIPLELEAARWSRGDTANVTVGSLCKRVRWVG
jgi:hypothetical protein